MDDKAAVISRRHAQIEVCDPRVFVKDLGSTNGTFIDEERLTGKLELHNGKLLRLGRTWLQISCD